MLTTTLKARITEHPQWYHTLDLGDGVVTPGWFDLRNVVDAVGMPASLAGKRCLDVATFDGFWAFAMERRGASAVVGIDLLDPLRWDWPVVGTAEARAAISERKGAGEGFLMASEALGSAVERLELSVYDLDPDVVGTFDFVYVGSLLLHAGGSRVVDAVIDAGYGSESRVYEKTGRLLGMTPGAMRRGGTGERIRTAFADGPFGRVLVGATDRGVCFLGFAEPDDALMGDLRGRFPNAFFEPDDEGLAESLHQVIRFLEEPAAALALPLDLRGTAFQQRVWAALCQIPRGETRTYAQVAEMIGAPRAVRAVARSCATNPVSLAVPCHRVIGKNGDLTGYRWGVPRKKALLARERKAGEQRR